MKHLTILFFLATNLCYGQQDISLNAQNAFDRAEYEDAFALFTAAAEEHIREDEPVAYVQCNLMMAECKVLMGEPYEGNQLAENTIAYLDRYFPEQNIVRGQALTLQGRAFLNLGRYDLALEYLEKARTLLGNEKTLELAQCLNDLGVVHLYSGNFELSRQNLEQSLSIRRTILSSTDLPIGDSFNNLGLFHQETDNPLQALIFYNRAKKIYEDKYGIDHPKTVLVSNNLAFAYASQGEFDEALNLANEVKSTLDQRHPGNHQRKAFAVSSLGRIQFANENYEAALVSQTEALRMYISLLGTKHPEVANTYFLIGEIYRKQGDHREAAVNFQNSIYANLLDQSSSDLYDLPEIRDYFNADILLSSLQSKAISLEALHYEKTLNKKDLTGAIVTYEKCDELISVIRQIRQNEHDKIRLGAKAKEVYESGIRLSITLSEQTFQKKYFLEKAFQFCERSKSAVLLEAITETKAKNFAGIPSELIAEEDSLKAEIAFFEQQLASGKDDERIKDLLFQYQSSYHDFIDRLEAEYPDYYYLKYNHQIATVAQVQSSIGSGAILLSYFVGESQIYLFEINSRGIRSHTFPKNEDFEKQTSGFRNAIKYQLEGSIVSTSKKLHEQLIPKKLGKAQSLIILPDGVLGTIPFEALIHPESEGTSFTEHDFLIRDYSIAYDYSATLLINRQSDEEMAETVLLYAPVNFQDNEVAMSTLPDSEEEVKEIRLYFMANGDADMRLKSEATESLLKSDEINKFKYLHFATHGQVNESKPELSRIFLTPSDGEDGSLYAGEIYNLKISADLVTLSACETGLGKIAKGEGIVGLSRALQYAGANNLIVSLWQVADKSTSDLMIKFYDRHLHSEYKGYARALREAKLFLLDSEEYQNPYYWAPFILVGY